MLRSHLVKNVSSIVSIFFSLFFCYRRFVRKPFVIFFYKRWITIIIVCEFLPWKKRVADFFRLLQIQYCFLFLVFLTQIFRMVIYLLDCCNIRTSKNTLFKWEKRRGHHGKESENWGQKDFTCRPQYKFTYRAISSAVFPFMAGLLESRCGALGKPCTFFSITLLARRRGEGSSAVNQRSSSRCCCVAWWRFTLNPLPHPPSSFVKCLFPGGWGSGGEGVEGNNSLFWSA